MPDNGNIYILTCGVLVFMCHYILGLSEVRSDYILGYNDPLHYGLEHDDSPFIMAYCCYNMYIGYAMVRE